jgi:acyl-CoA synthetase (AMP-forming)/AMP-acid ligase II
MDVHNTDTPNVSYDTWRNEAADTPLFVDVTDRDIAMLCYTSGSTGVPKGVPLTHGGISWCARTMRKAMLLGPEHRCLLAVPLFHANATTCGLWPMLEGGGSVVIQRDFDTAAVLRGLSEHGCTYTTGVPAMYKLMLRERELIESLDFPALQFVLCSSSEVPEALLREFEEVFGVPMIEGYGITEGGPMVLSNPRWGATKPGTSGIPLPGVELRISDREDPTIDAAQGEIGELLVRSPGVTPAYHNLPELSAERLLDGGWLRTRDLVRRDEQGYVKVVGRVDDMIICGGENIYPTEIENRLIAHPDVSDVAVVSRADEIKSQVPVAFVVAKAGTTINAEVIKQYALDTGPAYQHPRAVYLIDELPLTAAKKVDRSQLTQLAQAKANAMANL